MEFVEGWAKDWEENQNYIRTCPTSNAFFKDRTRLSIFHMFSLDLMIKLFLLGSQLNLSNHSNSISYLKETTLSFIYSLLIS